MWQQKVGGQSREKEGGVKGLPLMQGGAVEEEGMGGPDSSGGHVSCEMSSDHGQTGGGIAASRVSPAA